MHVFDGSGARLLFLVRVGEKTRPPRVFAVSRACVPQSRFSLEFLQPLGKLGGPSFRRNHRHVVVPELQRPLVPVVLSVNIFILQSSIASAVVMEKTSVLLASV